jgi:hypothetical protein
MLTRSLVTSRVHVYSEDPALDTDAPGFDYDKFMKTGDLSLIPTKPGEKVTVFELRALNQEEFGRLVDLPTGSWTQARETLALALTGVRDLVIDGQVVVLKHAKGRLQRESLEILGRIPAATRELAQVALALGRLDP